MTVTKVAAPRVGTHVRTRTVVAVAVVWRGRVGLFRRSVSVDHDRGMWHCITGYLEPGATPPQQALSELHEETGLGVVDLDSFAEGDIIELTDAHGQVWTVHTYRAATTRRRLVLNEEHDAHRWVQLRSVARFGNRVSWLGDVLAAAGVGTKA
jgi:ADP-ribose pyrophosphatase YjhB (NUDIX family)